MSDLSDTNGTRPFQNRPRRPLIGPVFGKSQQDYLDALERRVATLEAALAPPPPVTEPPVTAAADRSELMAPNLPTEAQRVKEQEAEATALAAQTVRLTTATPAMLTLFNESQGPEIRESLLKIIEEDKPAQVRLAAMRKALAIP